MINACSSVKNGKGGHLSYVKDKLHKDINKMYQ